MQDMRVAIVAGETSGDLLAAELIEALRQRVPDLQLRGVTGPRMRAAGCESLADISELSVMGLIEVLRHLPRLLRLRWRLRREILAWQPDIFIGVDAPDFNLGLAAWLRRRGLRALHFVSPSIWAWRRQRARTIGTQVDEVLCLFPFEPALYAEYGVPARFVGHPLADRLQPVADRQALRAVLGLSAAPLLAVLPGSRRGEVSRLGAPFVAAAVRFLDAHPGWQVALPVANEGCARVLDAVCAGVDGANRVLRLDGRSTELLAAADLALVASGTATLEAALVDTPMLVAYRLAPFSNWLVRTFGLLQSRWFSLPNALTGRALVPELAQEDVAALPLSDALIELQVDADSVVQQRQGFAEIRRALRNQASQRAADAILEHVSASAKGVA
ncbi:MAG: lipid-A-disaccharide synthase [Xanthomonadales bacterium]|nr:lipid-A-disaccharide synthase [Xanthomonadales bacterium]